MQWSQTIVQSDINHLSKAQVLPEIKVLVYHAMFCLRCLYPWPRTDLRSTHKLNSEGHSWITASTCGGLETPVDHRAVASSWRFVNAFLKVPSLPSPKVYCIVDSGHFFSKTVEDMFSNLLIVYRRLYAPKFLSLSLFNLLLVTCNLLQITFFK